MAYGKTLSCDPLNFKTHFGKDFDKFYIKPWFNIIRSIGLWTNNATLKCTTQNSIFKTIAQLVNNKIHLVLDNTLYYL